MNESEKPFFPEIFEEKMRKCDEIEDVQHRRDCKIDILEDAVKKIGANQKPVQWWLEVIAEGTKPLFDELRKEMATKKDLELMATKKDLELMATKEDLNVKFNALDVRLGTMREDLKTFKDNIINIFEDNVKDANDKFEKLNDKIDNFDKRLFKALGIDENSGKTK
ncbi:MAG: hypothetical protein ACTSPD_17065 [Promethearchaeota archaeon]